jgi:AMMECR1 domain-containing protein
LPEELNQLEIDINVLTPLKRIESYKDIVIGRDGVVLYKAGRQAVFLPSVPIEFGWDREELLSHLSIKAGLGSDGWLSGATFDVFQSEAVGSDSDLEG